MIRLNAGTHWRVMVAGCLQPRARRGALKPTPAGSQPQGLAGVLIRWVELSPRQMLCVLHGSAVQEPELRQCHLQVLQGAAVWGSPALAPRKGSGTSWAQISSPS